MTDKQELCEKIRELYPDIGECGLDVNVDFDEDSGAWVVDLRKDKAQLKTYLDIPDADSCMLGQKCIGLGIQIAMLRENIEKLKASQA